MLWSSRELSQVGVRPRAKAFVIDECARCPLRSSPKTNPWQFLGTLGELQASLRSRLLEVRSHETAPSPTAASLSPPPPTPEDVAGFDRRIEILRRKRDDLVADKAAAEAAAAAAATAAAAPREDTVGAEAQEVVASSTGAVAARGLYERERKPKPSRINKVGGDRHELWSGRRGDRSAGGPTSAASGEQGANAAQAEEVTQEIASMAGRLKESSMAINKTLRKQTRVCVL